MRKVHQELLKISRRALSLIEHSESIESSLSITNIYTNEELETAIKVLGYQVEACLCSLKEEMKIEVSEIL